MSYQTTQYGWKFIMLIALVLMMFVSSYVVGAGDNPIDTPGFIVIGIILLVSLLSFYRLQVIVRNKKIVLVYGIGLIRIRIRPINITDLQQVRTSWMNGWGIRFTGNGMLYNIQGNKAVMICYGAGRQKTVRIGTSRPDELMKAIKEEFQY